MNASSQEYKNLIEQVYKNVQNCPRCDGLNPDCICMEKFQRLCAIANARIPFKFRHAKIEQLVVEESELAKTDVEKYIRNIKETRRHGIGLWVSGRNQSGKTLVLCSILIGAIKAGYSTYYLELNEFYRLQEMRYSEESDQYHKLMGLLLSVDFLAIDGLALGIHGGKQASKQALAHLFHQRIDAKKPNVIGSILTKTRIEEFVNVAPEFPSLLNEGCPIYHDLGSGDSFVEKEAEKKRNFFEKLS